MTNYGLFKARAEGINHDLNEMLKCIAITEQGGGSCLPCIENRLHVIQHAVNVMKEKAAKLSQK